MKVEKKLYCHWDFVRFVKEEHLTLDDGTRLTLSVTDQDNIELMIFLGKNDSTSEYEVMVYKSEPTDKYVPYEDDAVKHFEENDEYVSFFFDDFKKALRFTDLVGPLHPEFQVRPIKIIGEN